MDKEELDKKCEQFLGIFNAAHYVNIQFQVRINGEFKTYEADWLKDLLRERRGRRSVAGEEPLTREELSYRMDR